MTATHKDKTFFTAEDAEDAEETPLMLFLCVLRVLCGESVFSVPGTKLRLALHPENRTLQPVQRRFLG